MKAKSMEAIEQLSKMIQIDNDLSGNCKPKSTQKPQSKFIRAKQGVEMYNLGKTRLLEIAREAGAVIKIDGTVLIDTVEFEKYLETFRIPKGYK